MSISFDRMVGVGQGTKQSSTSATSLAVAPHTNTVIGDLILAVIYASGTNDIRTITDSGDGWKILDSGYDSVNQYGIVLAGLISRRNGSAGYLGFTASSNTAYTLQTVSLRLNEGIFKFQVEGASRSAAWFNDTASSQDLTAPIGFPPYAQYLDVIGRGYDNGGTTTTVASVAGWSERFDVGQTSPSHGIVLNEHQVFGFSSTGTTITSSLAVAKTNRAGVRACIPIISNTSTHFGRYFSSRRLF